MSSLADKLHARISVPLARRRNNRWVRQLVQQVERLSAPQLSAAATARPVAFFNASTRLVGISLNAAFSLLASLGLRMAGGPVVHFVCNAGMSRCVLGTNRDNVSTPPPCQACIAQSRALYPQEHVTPFSYQPNPALAERIRDLSLEQLLQVESHFPITADASSRAPVPALPLGQLVLPSLRWVLRRHHFEDDEPTRYLCREYILSAASIAHQFSAFLDEVNLQAVVLFNGQFFPEAAARWVCLQRGIRTITHEVGLQPFSAFFTPGEATAYPLDIPGSFDLNAAREKRLDEYLSQRFQGQFSMAGIHFWPGMQGLGETFLQRAASFKQVVPIFTNVIFDTSQPHSNVIFPHMFAWLNLVLDAVRQHPETLFVLRAHPDETRPGKTSRESVSQWVSANQADRLPNLIYIDSDQALSSYELIQRAKFVMVYNSTIGLEASILGAPVLSAGRARYTQLPTVFFPPGIAEYKQLLESLLAAGEIYIPDEYKQNARRFLYYQLFRSSLPFADFLEEDGIWPGFVKLKHFPPQALAPSASPAMRAIYTGLIEGGDFLLEADD